jgi:hypothetical protein
VAALGGQVAERDRQVRLADTGWAEEDDVLGALDKGQAGEFVNLGRGTPVAKPKSKPSSVLIVGKPATRANISRARALRASRSARSVSSPEYYSSALAALMPRSVAATACRRVRRSTVRCAPNATSNCFCAWSHSFAAARKRAAPGLGQPQGLAPAIAAPLLDGDEAITL